MRRKIDLTWREVIWERPYPLDTVLEMFTHLASLTARGPVIWEVRSIQGCVKYFLGADLQFISKIQNALKAHGDIRFARNVRSRRAKVSIDRQLKITKPKLSLKTDLTESALRAGLSALMQTKGDEQTVLQIILGPTHYPKPTPKYMTDPHASWLDVILGNAEQATAENYSNMKEKAGSHGFSAMVRLGATGDGKTAKASILNVLSALRTVESAGVSINLAAENPEKLNKALAPRRFPLRLCCKELANFLLLPVGDSQLPGVAGLHPRKPMPPNWYRNPNKNHDRTFAVNTDSNTKLSISPQDSLEHTHITGPTGSGKSTAMLNLIMADVNAGRSVLVLDPKEDLVSSILERIPKERDQDVVVIDPTVHFPVGFNPLAIPNKNPELVADAILAVFQEVFKENWGITSQDYLSAALLTLAQTKGASLLWLPALFTDESFRKKITSGIKDKIGIGQFWKEFEGQSERERIKNIAPVLNKMRQFLMRSGLRNVLGQSDPKFSLDELFTKPKIVLVSLNKGTIGPESAKLLGSLIIGITWTLALNRARESATRRRLVSIYIDELQDYLALPTDLSDALAQARGLGVGLTLAHQYRDQLPPDIRAGVDTNARNKICFGLNAGDAKAMAAMAPGLEAEDFMTLPRYQVYASFQQDGRNTGWVHGQTLPPPPATRSPLELRVECMGRYGKPTEEVEADYLNLLEKCNTLDVNDDIKDSARTVGRRERL